VGLGGNNPSITAITDNLPILSSKQRYLTGVSSHRYWFGVLLFAAGCANTIVFTEFLRCLLSQFRLRFNLLYKPDPQLENPLNLLEYTISAEASMVAHALSNLSRIAIRIINPQYMHAGDMVVAQFTAEGTNDGPFGSLKPTGRKMSLPFCQICHFEARADSLSLIHI